MLFVDTPFLILETENVLLTFFRQNLVLVFLFLCVLFLFLFFCFVFQSLKVSAKTFREMSKFHLQLMRDFCCCLLNFLTKTLRVYFTFTQCTTEDTFE